MSVAKVCHGREVTCTHAHTRARVKTRESIRRDATRMGTEGNRGEKDERGSNVPRKGGGRGLYDGRRK